MTWPIQHQNYFAAFDLATTKREDVIKLLKAWTEAAARMTAGETAQPLEGGLKLAVPPATPVEVFDTPDSGIIAADTGETIGMSPSRLTITFGFGATLFTKDGKDRFGLASQRPEALVDMPKFIGDQLAENRTGGDISVQACAEDPQVAFHAVRQLARIAEGVAHIRWVQIGFRPNTGSRHLFGFSVEGMENPSVEDPKVMAKVVWSGNEGPEWMRGGSYIVARRMRFALEHWDQMPTKYQEKAVGGGKYHGSPMMNPHQSAEPSPAALEDDDPAAHPPSHLDIVGPHAATMFRRSYSYNDGVNFTTERWPPWRQGLEYDAGMFFICYQRDPRTGFIKLFDMIAKQDFRLNQFWTHEGSGLFACPPGVEKGGYIGQGLFEPK
ncbi:Dyp-type peroxidase [Geothrix sp. 21YS21S-4]|uniref:Dyp-type peroxidase n=1 Tax=Geothrix sp. 21YS21S-4 TaxID=3068889 RepID=UPI0027B9B7F7|nr:Dyp-type peroxidase [Geothrix sp. 21YS21S-4]